MFNLCKHSAPVNFSTTQRPLTCYLLKTTNRVMSATTKRCTVVHITYLRERSWHARPMNSSFLTIQFILIGFALFVGAACVGVRLTKIDT